MGKIIKIVDWTIDIPTTGEFFDRDISSTVFNVKFNDKVTDWTLQYNLNLSDKIYVYLHRQSRLNEIDFDFKFTTSIVNSSYTNAVTVCKSFWWKRRFGEDLPLRRSEGVLLMSTNVLRNAESHLCPNGKLLLRASINAMKTADKEDWDNDCENSDNDSLCDVEYMRNFSKSDNIFDMLTSSDTDILIKTQDGTVLKAHKKLLSEKSIVFQSMFKADSKSASSKTVKSVDIIKFTGPVMRELLRFIYFGNIQSIDQINVELFKAAKMYEIAHLPEICLKSIIPTINRHNVIEIIAFADQYGVEELFLQCCSMIRKFRHDNSAKIQTDLKKVKKDLLIKILDAMIMEVEGCDIYVTVQSCAATDNDYNDDYHSPPNSPAGPAGWF